MNKIDFETIIRTCSACPSQWEGKLDDGKRMFYARFRHGHFYLEFSNKPCDDVAELFEDSTCVLESETEDGDGYMTDWYFYRLLLKNNLLHANLSTRITIKYFSRVIEYLDEKKQGRRARRNIDHILKYGLFGNKEDE